jgi:serine/threonine-protein kinase
MFIGMAAGAAILPILVALLFLSGKKKEDSIGAESNAPIAVPVSSAPAVAPTESAAPPSSAAADPASPAPEAVASAPAAAANPASPDPPAAPAPVAAAGGAKKGGSTTKSTPTPAPPAPDPAPAPAPAGGGAKGTLVAVAMGGSCAFSVNGSSKGTSSSIRVALAPGRYSVTCKPSSGAAKSKSVVVKGGETAMATFRL